MVQRRVRTMPGVSEGLCRLYLPAGVSEVYLHYRSNGEPIEGAKVGV